jgi:hypothetical protein
VVWIGFSTKTFSLEMSLMIRPVTAPGKRKILAHPQQGANTGADGSGCLKTGSSPQQIPGEPIIADYFTDPLIKVIFLGISVIAKSIIRHFFESGFKVGELLDEFAVD